MKPLHITLAVIVVAGIIIGIIQFAPKDAVAPIQSDTERTNKQMGDEHMMSPEDHARMVTDSELPAPQVVPEKSTTTTSASTMDNTMMNMENTDPGSTNATTKNLMVHGENFQFDTKEIRVKKGDTVTITFMNMNGLHDFVIDEFNVQSERINTGGMTKVTFVADKKGTFEYYCSIGEHRANGMVGTLVVE